jgi:hypothetical protein
MSHVDREFNRAANDSPRSGSTKQTSPVVWGAITVAVVALRLISCCTDEKAAILAASFVVVVLCSRARSLARCELSGGCPFGPDRGS